MSRADEIRERLEKHILDELQCASATPTLEQWAELDPSGTRFGWLVPVEYDGVVTVMYQPEVLAGLCGDMTDDQVGLLMNTIEYLIDMHVWLIDVHPEDDRTRLVESMMYDECGEDAMAFLSRVQFASLGSAE